VILLVADGTNSGRGHLQQATGCRGGEGEVEEKRKVKGWGKKSLSCEDGL